MQGSQSCGLYDVPALGRFFWTKIAEYSFASQRQKLNLDSLIR